MQPTQDAIVQTVRDQEDSDMFGFRTSILIGYLDFEHAQRFIKEGFAPVDWSGAYPSPEKVLYDAKQYMGFAWSKALDHRGLSAGRSIDHYWAWGYMLDDAEVQDWCEHGEYAMYGAPILTDICRKYGWERLYGDFPMDTYHAERADRMAQGKRCSDDCEEC